MSAFSGADRKNITLLRDCEAVEIPAGGNCLLAGGSDVVLMQALGNHYTVYASNGSLYRISEKDADALGLAKTGESASAGDEKAPQSAREMAEVVMEKLKQCYDPEIPVNIVDLGLIYLCEAMALPDGGYRVDVRMTLTAPGCGMGPVLKSDVEKQIASIPNVRESFVELVFDPPWERERMSEAARLQLGML